jgi:hypothetical protein
LLAFRELDNALGLTALAGDLLVDPRTGKNGRHTLLAQFRQAVFGRLAGYEDVNDADRLGRDPAMRWIVGGRAVTDQAASTSQMGRFETDAMTAADNLTTLADLSGQWIDRVQGRRARTALVLDIDSSVRRCFPGPVGQKTLAFRVGRAVPGSKTGMGPVHLGNLRFFRLVSTPSFR